MRFGDCLITVCRDALCLDDKNIRYHTSVVHAKGKGVIPSTARSHSRVVILIEGQPSNDTLVDRREVLEFDRVKPKEHGWHLPICIAGRSPVLDGEGAQRLTEVTLLRDPMKESRKVRCRIRSGIVERAKIVLESLSEALPCVFESFVEVSYNFVLER